MNQGQYARGKQPCQNFQPNDSVFTGSGNVHDCYGCRNSTVSFCTNCNRDHHKNGYETCVPLSDASARAAGGQGVSADLVSVPRSVLFRVEAALSIQLANATQPDRQRSYEALESLRSALTQNGNDRSQDAGGSKEES